MLMTNPSEKEKEKDLQKIIDHFKKRGQIRSDCKKFTRDFFSDPFWLLPDGSFIDLEGFSHASIGNFESVGYVNPEVTFMKKFNGIRVSNSKDAMHIELSLQQRPTSNQWSTLKKCACEYNTPIYIDMIKGNTEGFDYIPTKADTGKCNLNIDKIKNTFNQNKI